jgi:hypothetical protein
MKVKTIRYLSLILLFACNTQQKEVHSTTSNNADKVAVVTETPAKSNIAFSTVYDSVFQSIGVVRLNNSGPGDVEAEFNLLNSDKSNYLTVSTEKEAFILQGKQYNLYNVERYEDELKSQFNFNPMGFYPEVGMIIQFKCIKETDDYYWVLVNDNLNDYKLLSKSNRSFTFEPWEKHLYRAFINFNPAQTPVFTSPNATETRKLDSSVIGDNGFTATEIKGEWMKIECAEGCSDCEGLKKFSGWIKWRNGYKLNIDLKYSC